MIEKNLEKIDEEIRLLKTKMEFGGPEGRNLCRNLENVLRDLKVFDQKVHRAEQLETDINRRFEAVVLALQKITKILKDNDIA